MWGLAVYWLTWVDRFDVKSTWGNLGLALAVMITMVVALGRWRRQQVKTALALRRSMNRRHKQTWTELEGVRTDIGRLAAQLEQLSAKLDTENPRAKYWKVY